MINYKSSGGSSGGDTGGGTTTPTTKGNAILIGVAATGHDHSTCFTEMITNLKACNLNNAIKYYGSFSVKSINSYLSSDSTAVFFSRSHAQDVRNSNGVLVGSELLLNDDSSNYIYYKSTQISSLKLSNLKLAVFVGCMTGIGGAGVNNLPSAAVKSGAKAAVGFRSSINCEKANKWSKEFTRYMKYGYTVGEACRVLSKDTEYKGSGLESCMFCGAESVTLK